MKNLLSILLFLPAWLHATTYYISNSGNSGNNGTTTSTTWNVAKANTFTFSASDNILFNRGETFARFALLGSGSSGSPITISSYGTGAKPIITSRAQVPGSATSGNWTNVSGNIWSMNLASPTGFNYRIWLDGNEPDVANNGTPTATYPVSYYIQYQAKLFIYSTTNPATAFSLIEYSGAEESLSINGNDYIIIDGLDVQGSTGGSIDFKQGSTHNIVRNCNIGMYSGRSGIRAWYDCTDYEIYDNVVNSGDATTRTFADDKRTQDGINFVSGCHRWNIYRNTVMNWGHSGIGLDNIWNRTGSADTSMTYIQVYDNYISNPTSYYMRGIGADAFTGRVSTGNKIFNNYIHNTNIRNQINMDGLVFQNNIINVVRSSPSTEPGRGQGLGIFSYSGTAGVNMKIRNNIIANTAEMGVVFGRANSSAYGPLGGNDFSNNIIYNCALVPLYGYTGVQLANYSYGDYGNIFRNNLIYKSGVTNVVYDNRNGTNTFQSVSTFNARNGTLSDVITSNFSADPLFTNPAANDLTLQAGSPAIGSGVNLGTDFQNTLSPTSVWPAGVITSIQPTSWYVGAYGSVPVSTGVGGLKIYRRVKTN